MTQANEQTADGGAAAPMTAELGIGGPPSADAPDDAPAALGRFALGGVLGKGGMGAVFRGRDPDLGRDLAIKILLARHGDNPHLERRFLEEARIAGGLEHPGLPAVHELGRADDGRPFFAMKLIKGDTLSALLAARTSPAEELPRFLAIFAQICHTIAYAHAHGVIHRDLKPANVMVGAFGEVQVMDWGLARGRREEAGGIRVEEAHEGPLSPLLPPPSSLLTQAGSVLGTFAYMAPEQARGEPADERSDVFGLGALLCEILTGSAPYGGARAFEQAFRADLEDALARLDGCGADPALIGLARRCLSAGPAGRPCDAGALAAELTAYFSSVECRLREAELANLEERARRAAALAAQAELQRTLTRQVAERLRGDLGRLEMVGQSLALLIEQRAEWDEGLLVGWLDALLRKEERIFGLFLAFEPGEFRPGVEDYGLYQYRGGPLGAAVTKHLVPPAYPYRELDFYAAGRATGGAHWTEPFLDADGGDIPMVCCTVPIRRGGRFVGIANVDISVKYFERLGGWLRELDFGEASHGFVISQTGLIISHPRPEYDFASLAAADRPPRHLADLGGGDAFAALARRILAEESGTGTAADPTTGRPATWMFARVRPAGWTFVAVIEAGGPPR